MSKKIAQLTKVIYHLNTMNEDNAYDIEQRSLEHQKEIKVILEDARGKINRFREVVEERKQEVNAAAEAEQIKRKLTQEKEKAKKELESFKDRLKSESREARQDANDKILNLRDEAAEMKASLKTAIDRFAEKERVMRAEFENNKGVATDEVSE